MQQFLVESMNEKNIKERWCWFCCSGRYDYGVNFGTIQNAEREYEEGRK